MSNPSNIADAVIAVLEPLERHPFATLALLAAGWLTVQGIHAWRARNVNEHGKSSQASKSTRDGA